LQKIRTVPLLTKYLESRADEQKKSAISIQATKKSTIWRSRQDCERSFAGQLAIENQQSGAVDRIVNDPLLASLRLKINNLAQSTGL
jgi:hypothetical protein